MLTVTIDGAVTTVPHIKKIARNPQVASSHVQDEVAGWNPARVLPVRAGRTRSCGRRLIKGSWPAAHGPDGITPSATARNVGPSGQLVDARDVLDHARRSWPI